MSPELILTGHCSKATDIFAAGVVLYILLCGFPPFQSKSARSNREVLERTARGQYRLDGPQWDEISEDAKDLVRCMLTTDPRNRITAAQVLAHPWLQNLDVPTTTGAGAAEGHSSSKDSSPSRGLLSTNSSNGTQMRVASSRRDSGTSLSGLRLLSGHVAERRSEKLATSFTRLVSFMQAGGAHRSSVLSQHVLLADGSPLPDDEHFRDEDMMILLNPDVRDALTSALNNVCEDGKMSVEQFLSVLRHFGVAPGGSGGRSGLPGIFLCRFIDRDNDGFISADDLFTTQALVMQRSDVFLRAVFRMYSEAIWYPGRQLNLVHYQRTPKKKVEAGGGNKVMEEAQRVDVVAPPSFINERHVAEIFSKLGYKPETGKHVFNVLCLALANRDRGDDLDSSIGRSNSSCIGGGGSGGCGIGGGDSGGLEIGGGGGGGEAIATSPNGKAAVAQVSVSPSATLSLERLASYDSTASNGEINLTSPTPTGTAKMDINDFIMANQLDDVLVQVLLRKPQARLLELIKKAEKKSEERSSSSSASSSTTEYASSVLEAELIAALNSAKEESRATFPIANAVGRATFNAALDLAAKVTKGAQSVLQGLTEHLEGGSSSGQEEAQVTDDDEGEEEEG